MNKYEEPGEKINKYANPASNETSTSNVTIELNITMPTTTLSSDGLHCPPVMEADLLNAEFSWDKKLQGFILGAFFWGYTAMQMPSGFLSDRFGPRLTVTCGMFPVALLTILSPFLARGSPYLLLVGRVLIGMGEVRI